MAYVDGVVAPATPERESYRDFAAGAANVVRAHGAVRAVECRADDLPFADRCMILGGFDVVVDA